MTYRVLTFLLLAIAGIVSGMDAQPAESGTGPVADSTRLKGFQKDARGYYDAFKNREAFGSLIEYAGLQEKLQKEAAAQRIRDLSDKHEQEIATLKEKLQKVNGSIADLREANDSVTIEKNRLRFNTLILFLLLSGGSFSILMFLRGRFRAEERQRAASQTRLSYADGIAGVADTSMQLAADTLFSYRSLFELTPKTQSQIGKLRAMSVSLNIKSESMLKAEETIERINELAENGQHALEEFEKYFRQSDDKEVTNLNAIIDDTMHLSYLWMKSRYPDFECAMSRDLEKILPEIGLYPADIRKALFCFFNNAFSSVYEKSAIGQKDYEGRVTVISRRLPRFVQVRIRDNGVGLDDKLHDKVFEPFYSTRPAEHGTGLGLTTGADIVRNKHQGEVTFETDTGYGTDILVRFPLEV